MARTGSGSMWWRRFFSRFSKSDWEDLNLKGRTTVPDSRACVKQVALMICSLSKGWIQIINPTVSCAVRVFKGKRFLKKCHSDYRVIDVSKETYLMDIQFIDGHLPHIHCMDTQLESLIVMWSSLLLQESALEEMVQQVGVTVGFISKPKVIRDGHAAMCILRPPSAKELSQKEKKKATPPQPDLVDNADQTEGKVTA